MDAYGCRARRRPPRQPGAAATRRRAAADAAAVSLSHAAAAHAAAGAPAGAAAVAAGPVDETATLSTSNTGGGLTLSAGAARRPRTWVLAGVGWFEFILIAIGSSPPRSSSAPRSASSRRSAFKAYAEYRASNPDPNTWSRDAANEKLRVPASSWFNIAGDFLTDLAFAKLVVSQAC